MQKRTEFPKTLQQAIIYFADPENASNFLMQMRWPNGVECPICSGREVSYLSTAALTGKRLTYDELIGKGTEPETSH